MRLAVIADHGRVPRFGLEALKAIPGPLTVSLFSCTNTRLRRRAFRHAAYYALNLVSVRNAWTRLMPLAEAGVEPEETVEFESGYEGAWQLLPPEIIERLNAGGFDAVLKLGMGLLRVPPGEILVVPILSYHHGDPDRYRGRPAGFWEMAADEPVMGQMIQVIGNTLDAGRVIAFGETKVHNWSYRATLIESYRHSPLLMPEALRNLRTGQALAKPCTGKNYRLPSNLAVLRFAAGVAARFVRRLAYGAVMEKGWRVSLASSPEADRPAVVRGEVFPSPGQWRTLEAPKAYVFYADPFFSPEGEGILVEALARRSGLGEIVLVEGEAHRRVFAGRGHLSYPAVAEVKGRKLILPEMAGWSPPRLFALEEDGLAELGPLPLEEEARLLDPTLVEHEERLYLFANIKSVGSNALYLWSADSLEGPFRRHPASPILVSPKGARMAGNLLRIDGRLIRFGQDFSDGYGDGIHAFEIAELSPDAYRESPAGSLRFADRNGPHTLNFSGDRLLFDWYRDRFSPLAGLRRLAARRRGIAPPA
jgi:hypothetical protein